MNIIKNRFGLRLAARILVWLRKRSRTKAVRSLEKKIVSIDRTFKREITAIKSKHAEVLDRAYEKQMDLAETIDALTAVGRRNTEIIDDLIKDIDVRDKVLNDLNESGEKSQAQIRDIQSKASTLELTLQDKERYISEQERSIQERDTRISLQRMEIESLTLWRENQNRQLRTEADIAAAKSKVLTGKSPERILEQLKNVKDVDNR